jgi:outer membrane protein assembly factor BamB
MQNANCKLQIGRERYMEALKDQTLSPTRFGLSNLQFAICNLQFAIASLSTLLLFSTENSAEPWATYRGNIQRTANTDKTAGPANPKVLWVHKAQEHYVAALVPDGDKLFLSGLGAFNVSTFYELSTDPKAAQRALWTKTTPYLKLPTVSSPALMDGKLIFGDGMHQTDGATLHCITVDKGLPLWQLRVPGDLVHLEGSPTIAGGMVYLGGGAAGVLCVDPSHVTLDGKELDLKAIQKVLDEKWAVLLKKYEEDKKKDPDFAVPPNEDQLPKPSPKLAWQQGEKKWHVDAPVTVVGDKVLVASAFLDKEKVGDRALFCLDAKTGEVKWRAPLKLNPWGGPSVIGDTIIVSGSTIGYDTKALKEAKGDLTAINLADGKEKWRKEITTGGVIGCAALTDDVAVVTATDGKVRAFNLTDGERRWIYDAKTPLFAPAAVAGGVVYAGDLKGVMHAINLANGEKKWTLDLGTDPDVKAPGMIYGGPIVHGGRIYVATCNIEGTFAQKPTVVVCIGEK